MTFHMGLADVCNFCRVVEFMHTLLSVYDTSSLSMFSEQQPLVSLVIVTMVIGVTVSPCGDRDIYPLATAGAEHFFWTCFHLCFLPFAYF